MASTPQRSVATGWVVQFIFDELGVLVGRVTAPDGAGWQADSSQVGAEFIPYIVATPGSATPVNPSFNDPSDDWSLAYQLTSYGTDNVQVEDTADKVRALLLATKKVSLAMNDGTWRITTIRCNNIGGVGYTTAVSPTAFSQTDSYTLTLSRSLS